MPQLFQATLDQQREYRQTAIAQGRINFDLDMWIDSDPSKNESDLITLIMREHNLTEAQANRAYRNWLATE